MPQPITADVMFDDVRTYTIYKITNLVNGKCYIGQTINTVEHRWAGHCRSSGCPALAKAIAKYGKDNFIYYAIDTTSSLEELDRLECYWIKRFNSIAPFGYNLTSGGQEGRFISDEAIAKFSKSLIGHKVSEETRIKIQKQLSGRRIKPVKVNRRKLITRRGQSLKKSVIGTHIDTGEEIILESMSSDSRFDFRLISACCRGKRRSHRRYSWRYK